MLCFMCSGFERGCDAPLFAAVFARQVWAERGAGLFVLPPQGPTLCRCLQASCPGASASRLPLGKKARPFSAAAIGSNGLELDWLLPFFCDAFLLYDGFTIPKKAVPVGLYALRPLFVVLEKVFTDLDSLITELNYNKTLL